MATALVGSNHQVAGISFTPEQLAERRKTLGASEIGAVAGLNRNRTPIDVWAEKRGLVPPFAGNEFTEWGLRFESAIRQKYIEVSGNEVESVPPNIVSPQDDWMSASPDGLMSDRSLGLEIKRFGEHRTDDFGPAGTDQVPMEVAAQAHWNMMVVDVGLWDVAVLLGQADFRIYHLRFDAQIADHLREIGKKFWFENVVAGVQPEIDGSSASHKFLQQRYGKYFDVMLDPTPEQRKLAELLVQVRKDLKARESEESHLEAQLKLAIGEATGLRGLCTWKAPRSGPVSWKNIAETLVAKFAIPQETVQPIIAANTNEPSRRFLLTLKDGE